MTISTVKHHDCARLNDKRNQHLLDIIIHRSIEKRQGEWFLTFDDRSDLSITRCPICGTTLA